MKSKALRQHDQERRRERRAMKVVAWFVQHGWVSGWCIAAYGLAEEGYTDRPSVEPDRFTIERRFTHPTFIEAHH